MIFTGWVRKYSFGSGYFLLEYQTFLSKDFGYELGIGGNTCLSFLNLTSIVIIVPY